MQDFIGQSFGRYHISERLGEGGMALVYKAFDTRLERDVALKVIRTDRVTDELFLKRFEREARALAQLSHPNIVHINDYGEQDGVPYLVMDYLPGGTLKDLIQGPMEYRQAARLLLPVARALGYAHSKKILHRDVKPGNILITESGEPMLTDFGIARILESEETVDLTSTGMGVGTPSYMAPEQTGRSFDHRVDVYALGVVFYEMLTGRTPYRADTPLATLMMHASDPLPDPKKFAANLPQQAVRVLVKALQKKPDDRYQSMTEFANALEKLVGGAAVKTEKRSNRWIGWAVGGLAVVALAVAGVMLLNGGGDAPESVSWQEQVLEEEEGLTVGPLGAKATLQVEDEIAESEGLSIGPPGAKATLQAEAAAELPTKEPTSDLELGIGSTMVSVVDDMEMVYVPAGAFIMGSNDGEGDEQPVHEVFLDAYWIDKYEVTNEQFVEFLNESGNQSDGGVNWLDANDEGAQIYHTSDIWKVTEGSENLPVVEVSWYGAEAYCEWAERRLPSEAEWEKAARGTDERTYPWGEDINCEYAQYGSCGVQTEDVSSFPNGASLYGGLNMAGNVWEWVADWYDDSYYSVSAITNPTGPSLGGLRVIRGGSWDNKEGDIRSANRFRDYPGYTYDNYGFRCATSP